MEKPESIKIYFKIENNNITHLNTSYVKSVHQYYITVNPEDVKVDPRHLMDKIKGVNSEI